MRKSSFLFLSTFILGALAQQNITTTAPFDPNEDNYRFKPEVINGQQSGFTIEYKNYYKVVTNLVTNTKYCLIGWNQLLPADCSAATSFQTPVSMFNVDDDSHSVIPFVEILGLQSKLSSNINTQNVTSPCVTDGSKNTIVSTPAFVFSSRPGNPYVSFSGDDDSIAPLDKAGWLLYVAAFFDMELEATSALNQISNNYNCHKANYAISAKNTVLSWTYFDPSIKVYTIRGDNYFTQLAQDASATLSTPNRLQNKTFTSSVVDLHSFAKAIQGSDFIIDESQPSLDYSTWFETGRTYLEPNSSYADVKAIRNNQVYTVNGLVNKYNDSDWSQRSAARPDLALLELIKLFDPNFSVAGALTFPIWLTSFSQPNRRLVNEAVNYGSCQNMTVSIGSQTVCSLGGGGQTTYKNLSTGDKAGISVGAIFFVLFAALIGIWLFRKYRRNQRHNFYRMNDL